MRQVEICFALLNAKIDPTAVSHGHSPPKKPQKYSRNVACSALVACGGGTMERMEWGVGMCVEGCRGCKGMCMGWERTWEGCRVDGGILRDAEGCGDGSWGF